MPFDPTRVRAIIFDVDGTLCDTDDEWKDDIARWLTRFGVKNPQPLARRIATQIMSPGNSVLALLDRLGIDAPLVQSADWLHRWRWRENNSHFRLVPGVMEMLGALHPHFPLAVCSARNGATINSFLHQFDLNAAFMCVATALTTAHTKPWPEPLLWCAKQMNVAPAQCVMVGDTSVDMRAGRAAGMQCVGVLCGFGEARELNRAGADTLINSTADVAGLLACLAHS